jgi:hypothetical protein
MPISISGPSGGRAAEGGLLWLGLAIGIAGSAMVGAASLTEAEQDRLRPAHRHDQHGWVYVHIEGSAPDRGFQHGCLLAKEIAEGLRRTRLGWEYRSAMTWAWLAERAGALFTPQIDRENLAELDGMAEGLQAAGVSVTRNELIAYNGIIKLSYYWWPQELRKIKDGPLPPVRESCSSFIATGRMTRDGNVVLGHNTMTGYESVLPNVVVDLRPERGHRLLMQICPGWIHSGMDFFVTDAGLVGSETTIGGFEGFATNGIPEFVRMRRATQDAGSIDEWCAIMQKGNNGGYANAWLLGDVNSREIARLELGLKYVGFEKKRDGYFLGSNVAEDPKILRFETDAHETDIRDSAIARRVRWKQLVPAAAGKLDLARAKQFEADHYDTYLKTTRPGGRTLCGHFELDREPAGPWPGVPFGPAGTVDAKVVDASLARQMSFAARWGAACGRPFDAAKFLAAHPQFDWMRDILPSRPAQPWTVFRAGETD